MIIRASISWLTNFVLAATATLLFSMAAIADDPKSGNPKSCDADKSTKCERAAQECKHCQSHETALERRTQRIEGRRESRENRDVSSSDRAERVAERRQDREERMAERDVRERIARIREFIADNVSRVELAIDDEGHDKIIIHLGTTGGNRETATNNEESTPFQVGDRLTISGRDGRIGSRILALANQMASSEGRSEHLTGHIIDMEYGPAVGANAERRGSSRRFDDTSHLNVCIMGEDGKSSWVDLGDASKLSSELAFNVGDQLTVYGAVRGRGDRSRLLAQEMEKDGNAYSLKVRREAAVADRERRDAPATTTK